MSKGGDLLAPTGAQKRASAKYQRENIASLACRVKKEQAEKFKAYCESIGKTSNAVLRECVLSCIGEAMGESPQKPAGAPQGDGAILTPAALKTAQEAAQRAGETVPAFVGRAVETQAQRDKVMQAMRTKEKAPDKSET